MSAFRNPHNLPTKVCVTCNREFTWRKKWEKNWDEITTCSKRCNTERKRALRKSESEESDAGSSASTEAGTTVLPARDERKAARKAAKAERRERRAGRAKMSVGQKHCDMCGSSVNLLIRCQLGPSKEWSMVCGKCWGTDAVAGGVVDGDGSNPHYRYGGLWRNHHQARGRA